MPQEVFTFAEAQVLQGNVLRATQDYKDEHDRTLILHHGVCSVISLDVWDEDFAGIAVQYKGCVRDACNFSRLRRCPAKLRFLDKWRNDRILHAFCINPLYMLYAPSRTPLYIALPLTVWEERTTRLVYDGCRTPRPHAWRGQASPCVLRQ